MALGVLAACFSNSLVNAQVLFILAFSLVPFNEQLLSFKRRQQRQLGEFARRVGNHFRQYRLQVAQHSADCFTVEPLTVIDCIQLQFGAGKRKQCERVVGSRKDGPDLLDVRLTVPRIAEAAQSDSSQKQGCFQTAASPSALRSSVGCPTATNAGARALQLSRAEVP